jgi:hypothetical protein
MAITYTDKEIKVFLKTLSNSNKELFGKKSELKEFAVRLLEEKGFTKSEESIKFISDLWKECLEISKENEKKVFLDIIKSVSKKHGDTPPKKVKKNMNMNQ